jgi:hypothetical protein
MKNMQIMETDFKRFPGHIQEERSALVKPVLAFSMDRNPEQAIQSLTLDLGERVKERNCFYGISRIVEEPGYSLDEILQQIVELIPISWQHPERTCAQITLEDQVFSTTSDVGTVKVGSTLTFTVYRTNEGAAATNVRVYLAFVS